MGRGSARRSVARRVDLGDVAGARKSYRRAIDRIGRRIAAGSAGDRPAAIDMTEKGLALRRRLAAERPDARRRQELALALQYRAYVFFNVSRVDEALDVLKRQATLFDELLRTAS